MWVVSLCLSLSLILTFKAKCGSLSCTHQDDIASKRNHTKQPPSNCTCGAVKPWVATYMADKLDFNSTHVDEYQLSYFPFPIWRDESMHDLLVRVALSAADAVAQSGRSMRMGQHVMLRVDIALTRQGNMVSSC